MIGLILFLSIGFLFWIAIRAFYKISPTHLKIFWVAAVLFLIGPFFTPLSNHPALETAWAPFFAGLIAGEYFYSKYWPGIKNKMEQLNGEKNGDKKWEVEKQQRRKKRKKPEGTKPGDPNQG